jgi:hypothetical protein
MNWNIYTAIINFTSPIIRGIKSDTFPGLKK